MTASSTHHLNCEVAVVGSGLVGLTAAVALARGGRDVVHLAPPAGAADGRTVAVMEGSQPVLDSIGVWRIVESIGHPLRSLRIIDDTDSLFRIPPVTFDADELGLDAFGYNVVLRDLEHELRAIAQTTPGLRTMSGVALGLTIAGTVARVSCDEATIEAKLVIGADGRRSVIREASGIRAREWDYPQSALTTILAHTRPHDDISTEFHTRTGPCTVVPMAGARSSLVWMTEPVRAVQLMALPDTELAKAISRQIGGILGQITITGPRGLVPMRGLSVRQFARGRVALVGEAAHVFPPIGAQGLNLGLRDVAALVACVAREGSDPGGSGLARYDAARRSDVASRTAAVDLLDRALLSSFLPVDLARGLGLLALDAVGPLRRFVMRQGLAPGSAIISRPPS